jgi:RsiW-degrading membrane proteinase PrsW (M82 family)
MKTVFDSNTFLVSSLFAFAAFIWYFGQQLAVWSLILGGVLALIPIPLFAYNVIRFDKSEPEPRRLLLGCFIFGGTVAVAASLVLNSVLGVFIGADIVPIFIAPVVEEICKGLGLVLLMVLASRDFNGVKDAIVYSTMIGLGFAMSENLVYYARSETVAELFVMRGVISAYAHPLFTSMTGIGIALSNRFDNKSIILGFIAAVILHMIWNGSLLLGSSGYHLMLGAVYVPSILFIYKFLRRKENA